MATQQGVRPCFYYKIEVEKGWKIVADLLVSQSQSLAQYNGLLVDMFPHKVEEDMPTFWARIVSLFPNIDSIIIQFDGNEHNDKLVNADTNLVYDFEGLAVLLNTYKSVLKTFKLKVDFQNRNNMVKQIIHGGHFVGALIRQKKLSHVHVDIAPRDRHVFAGFAQVLYDSMFQAVFSLDTLQSLRVEGGCLSPSSVPITSPWLQYLAVTNAVNWGPQWLSCSLELPSSILTTAHLDFRAYATDTTCHQPDQRLGRALANHLDLRNLTLVADRGVENAIPVFNAFGARLSELSSLPDDSSSLKLLTLVHVNAGVPARRGSFSTFFHGVGCCKSLTSVRLIDLISDDRDDESVSSDLLSEFPHLLRCNKTWEAIQFEAQQNDIDVDAAVSASVANAISGCPGGINKMTLDFYGGTVNGWEGIVASVVNHDAIVEFCLRAHLPDYCEKISAALKLLGKNRSLRRVEIRRIHGSRHQFDCFDQTFVENLKENYFLQELKLSFLDPIRYRDVAGNCEIICRLNRAGRKYMVEDNSIGNAVQCLINLSESPDAASFKPSRSYLDCVYFHLRENAAVFFSGSDGLELEIQTEQERFMELSDRANSACCSALSSGNRLMQLAQKQGETQRKRKLEEEATTVQRRRIDAQPLQQAIVQGAAANAHSLVGYSAPIVQAPQLHPAWNGNYATATNHPNMAILPTTIFQQAMLQTLLAVPDNNSMGAGWLGPNFGVPNAQNNNQIQGNNIQYPPSSHGAYGPGQGFPNQQP